MPGESKSFTLHAPNPPSTCAARGASHAPLSVCGGFADTVAATWQTLEITGIREVADVLMYCTCASYTFPFVAAA